MPIIQAEKIISDGSAISHSGGKVVFVPFAIPNETIEIEITEQKKNYDRAKIKKIISPSPNRIKPICEYYGICGGCNMMHISYDAQTQIRTEMMRDVLLQKKIVVKEILLLADEAFFYRARFTLHGGSLFQKKAHTKIPVKHCVCATPEINAWLLKTPAERRGFGELRVFGDKTLTGFTDKIAISKTKKNFQQQRNNADEKLSAALFLLGKKIFFDVNGFFQSNIRMLEKLLLLLQKKLHGTHLLDLYAGCGTFSFFLQNNFKTFTLVEENKNAAYFTEKNLQNVPHKFYAMKGSEWTKLHREKKFDCAIIDPPRTGMEKEVCAYFAETKIPTLCSISCDIATHARDLCLLIKAGYAVRELYLLDFYPNTNRIESLAFLLHEKNKTELS